MTFVTLGFGSVIGEAIPLLGGNGEVHQKGRSPLIEASGADRAFQAENGLSGDIEAQPGIVGPGNETLLEDPGALAGRYE